jgi:hypothetical protein
MSVLPKSIPGALGFALLTAVAPVPLLAGATGTYHVDACATGLGDGSQANPYTTLTPAEAAAGPGSTIVIHGGSYPEHLTITNNLTLTGSAIVGESLVGEYLVGSVEVCMPVTVEWNLFTEPLETCAISQSSTSVHAKVYYPSQDHQGTRVACGGPFPAVVYTHGNREADWALCAGSNPGPIHQDYRQVEGILRPLAAAGFIIVSVDSSWGSSDPNAKGEILINAIAYLRDQNEPGGLLEGSVDLNRVGLSGHSVGGGAAVFALERYLQVPFDSLGLDNVQIQALGLIAPGWQPGFSSPPDGTALLVIHGTREHEKQVAEFPVELYDAANAPKHLLQVNGANHFGYTDGICLDPDAADPRDNSSEVGGSTGLEAHRRQQMTARNYLRAFFTYYLLGDETQLDYLSSESGLQCDESSGLPISQYTPVRTFDDLDDANVEVNEWKCYP